MVQLLPFSLDELQQGQVPGLTDLMWRGLHKWTRLAGAAALPPVLVDGGDENMTRQGVTVQSWWQIFIEN